MNEVIKALLERRSIRKFESTPVDEETLQTILKAGIYAPSARNSQAWQVTAITNPQIIEKVNQAMKTASQTPGFDKYAAFVKQEGYSINFKTAPVFLIVSVDPSASFAPPEEGALVLGNIFLAAHSLGLGTCWVNQLGPICDEPGFRAILTELGVPAAYRIIGCAALGHPAGNHPSAPARKEGAINIVR
ncbi:nitroreductase [Deltaproteobacteria bacterium Smac51]|nr:nitroreductase [Deltaproteobacteria bacterium Smac51]